ncbi:hypothetical protein [Phaeobacter sp. J2-8]|uniref:hypothetical protein n=1 Tax=Phaeobacter sp. J2-8 TaxID=2931394 RepID=UPI001FD37F05|nr:hypothetical protein [Phaeobacter sp. J2-8]MCJ7872663.1 hypothetical protein [Phaeobacter sp. J2-8]
MQPINPRAFARSAADQIIARDFGRVYGVTTLTEYFDLIDRRSTAHLIQCQANRVIRTAGHQRRKARLTIEGGQLLVSIPMNDPRSGRPVWAVTDFGIWIDLLEGGFDAAWVYNHKGENRRFGQVRIAVPVAAGYQKAAVTRIITNAKAGQQARTRDGNPLNLRRSNLYILGQPGTAQGRVGRAKTDTLGNYRASVEVRRALARKSRGAADQ